MSMFMILINEVRFNELALPINQSLLYNIIILVGFVFSKGA